MKRRYWVVSPNVVNVKYWLTKSKTENKLFVDCSFTFYIKD